MNTRVGYHNPIARCTVTAFAALLMHCNRSTPAPASPKGLPDRVSVEAQAPTGFSAPPAAFDELVKRAREDSHTLGKEPTRLNLPPSLQNLDYEAYRTIRFRGEHSLFRGEAGHFEVQFFHVGLHYFEPLRISVLENGQLKPIPFSTDLFSYEGMTPPPKDAELGFSGFRVHAPLNSEQYRDEIIVFQGASYFRSLGRGQTYGLSGRALAINTGEPGPEEFPRFTEFVLVRPAAEDAFIWILGFLESPHAVGAYAFRLTPGDTTQIEVTAHVYPRGKVDVFGLAPLTSMFLFGEEAPARFGGDHPHLQRPEAHDSDGLLMWGSSGEWLYRPLRNPPHTQVTTFRLDSPRGFGLLQRDRNPEHYRDPEYAYEKRPSAWVEPVGDWGKGSVRLLEIATPLESDDNIGAMWVPDEVPADGLLLHYRVHIGDEMPSNLGPTSKVTSTRFWNTEGRTKVALEFTGAALAQAASLDTVVTAVGHSIENQKVEREADRVQLEFDVVRADTREVELRAFLKSGEHAVSETFIYLLPEIPKT